MDIKSVLENGAAYYLPNLSIDIVVIGYEKDDLKCLLVKSGDNWMLPGGYIKRDESVKDAVKNVLKERTGLSDAHIMFLSVFGGVDRKFGPQMKSFFEKKGLHWDSSYWINDRFVTLAHYSLVNIEKINPQKGFFEDEIGWFSISALPNLAIDHKAIIEEARERLKKDINQENITYNLLPEYFTMPDLHKLHQLILDENIDRSRFQKKMLGSGKFERLPEIHKNTPGRNPYLYKVKCGE